MLRDLLRAIRRFAWRHLLGLRRTHPTFLCGGFSSISKDFVAGAYSFVAAGAHIQPGVSIGAYTMLGPNVKILGNDHVFDTVGSPIIFSGRPQFKRTEIGTDVWIGANSIIIAGNSIGDGSIVAAGSVVTKDVGAGVVVAGVPARVIRRRFASSESERIHFEFLRKPPVAGEYCGPVGK